MSIYDVAEIEKQIEQIAIDNDGEIPEEKLQQLVEAQTKSMASLEKMCRFIRHLEMFEETADSEIKRIKQLKESAAVRLASVKKFMTPYVKERGNFDAGTFRLSVRKSEKVIVPEDFNNPSYCKEVTTIKPDKVLIKKDLKAGIDIEGAHLVTFDNLQIK